MENRNSCMEELLGIQSSDNDNLSPGINQQPCSYRFVCIPECCTTEWSHSRVRMDAGGENVLVSHYMTEMRDIGCNSAMLGRSVHNQRIEICGEICSMAAPTFSISLCISWRTLIFSTLATRWIYMLCTTSLWISCKNI